MAVQIAVCGPRACTEEQLEQARQVGVLLARAGAIVLCGGGIGVMAAVAAGARSEGGLVIGIRPDADRATASPDLSAVVLSNLGEARNAVLVNSADAVIVVGCSWGTLSELALAMGAGRPVVTLGAWRLSTSDGRPVPGPVEAATAEEAVARALESIPAH